MKRLPKEWYRLLRAADKACDLTLEDIEEESFCETIYELREAVRQVNLLREKRPAKE